MAQSQPTLMVERNRLARLEQSLENRLVVQEDIENELLSYEYKLERARESLESLHQKYEESRLELAKAQQNYDSSPNVDTQRQLTKAKHSFDMAERGVDSRSRRLKFIQANHGTLRAKLAEEEYAITETRARISAQQETVNQMVKTMLAQAEESERRAALAKSAVRLDKPELKTAPLQEAPRPEVMPRPVPVAAEREVDSELLAYVQREQERLRKLLADENSENRQTFNSLELRSSGGKRLPFEFLGKDQYRLVTTVDAGRQTYKINSWKFRRTVPAEDGDTRYVFVFDARRLSRPRLVMYPEYALKALN
ncbi:hypothetical protein [Microbulbifer sp. 2205BS26-8]|uniref:hypothetical protein n=1 Tax=Microbulbifer sp. 2205BS26-8 TaxID=3064386 RepID=UPI00273F58A5|nr:hypothetical protein [Microbulbifer sp. 2205BS26-8]MDP5209967.1 hypothetical protein [Microbulbifer sp. 2205BS26-8]